MKLRKTILVLAGLLAAGAVQTTAIGRNDPVKGSGDYHRSHSPSKSFQRIATLPNYLNNGEQNLAEETVSEIVAATHDGMTLVYTGSPGEQFGFVDITDPADPKPAGVLGVGGEPNHCRKHRSWWSAGFRQEASSRLQIPSKMCRASRTALLGCVVAIRVAI